MIIVKTGTPGSGKTLSAIKDIRAHKGLVVSNIETKLESILKLPENPSELVEIALRQQSIKEGSILLVIDEAQMIFNCREWSAKNRKDWLFFLTHHRKYGYKVIMVTQSLSFLDKQIRQLVEYEYRYRRLSRWGWVGFILYFLTFGEKYLYVQYYVPNNERMGLHISLLGRRLFKYYDTFAIPNKEFSAVSDAQGVRSCAGSEQLERTSVDYSKLQEVIPILDYNLTTLLFWRFSDVKNVQMRKSFLAKIKYSFRCWSRKRTENIEAKLYKIPPIRHWRDLRVSEEVRWSKAIQTGQYTISKGETPENYLDKFLRTQLLYDTNMASGNQ